MNIVLIPARGGSKRIAWKNLKLLGGKPLLQWSIEAALKIQGMVPELVWVSTDAQEIANCAFSLGVRVVNRPWEFATDDSTDHDVIGHLLDFLSDPPDRIIYLRPTTPFRDAKVLNAAMDKMVPNIYASLRSVHPSTESTYKTFTMSGLGELVPIRGEHGEVWSDAPNQMCPKTYIPNGYIDIIFPKREVCRRGAVYGPHILGFETEPVIELDTQEQWEQAEWWLNKQNMEVSEV